jgi:hypothetical protein
MNEQKYLDLLQDDHSDSLERMNRRVRELETALEQIKTILAGPASNRAMMQIAGPARRCLNVIKSTEAANTQP